MSLFLVYFEAKETKTRPAVSLPLVQMPAVVVVTGKKTGVHHASLLTDGVASDFFLRYGAKVADRKGEELRKKLFELLRQRLEAGARPHLVFIWVSGWIEPISVDLEKRTKVLLSQLGERFPKLNPSELIELVSDEATGEAGYDRSRRTH